MRKTVLRFGKRRRTAAVISVETVSVGTRVRARGYMPLFQGRTGIQQGKNFYMLNSVEDQFYNQSEQVRAKK